MSCEDAAQLKGSDLSEHAGLAKNRIHENRRQTSFINIKILFIWNHKKQKEKATHSRHIEFGYDFCLLSIILIQKMISDKHLRTLLLNGDPSLTFNNPIGHQY